MASVRYLYTSEIWLEVLLKLISLGCKATAWDHLRIGGSLETVCAFKRVTATIKSCQTLLMLKVALNISLVLISHHVRLLRTAPCNTTHSINPSVVHLRWILLLVKEGRVFYLHVIWCPEKFATLRTAL